MIRVLVADDHRVVRAGLRVLLDAEDDITVIAEAGDGAAALALASEHRPDVVVMDIRMPGMDGLEATRAIAADPALGQVRVLVLTTFSDEEHVFSALRAGASGFLLKDAEPEVLVQGTRLVAAGEALLAPAVTRQVVEAFAAAPTPHGPAVSALAELTAREVEIVALAGRGLSNQEIAAELVISPATARTHVSRAMVKLGARDRAQLVVFAYESGLVRVGGLPRRA